MRRGGIDKALPLFGVLGGMGPLATAEFYRQLVLATPARRDQDHIPLLLRGVPQIDDRSAGITGLGPSPLAAMVTGIRELNAAGVSEIAIACNTAHHWHAELRAVSEVPVLHIADAAMQALTFCVSGPCSVGLLGTEGTIRSGFYLKYFEPLSLRCLAPSVTAQRELVDRGIALVKCGALGEARACLDTAARQLVDGGADVLLLGCTEIGVVLHDAEVPIVDANRAFAQYCARRWRGACTTFLSHPMPALPPAVSLQNFPQENTDDFHL